MDSETEPQAYFSGYHMSLTDLQDLAMALDSKLADTMKRRHGGRDMVYRMYFIAVCSWRGSFSSEKRHDILPLRVELDWPSMVNNKYFFTTRFIEAPSGRMEDCPESVLQETDHDKARLDKFLAIIKAESGYSVDPSTLQFGTFLEPHPAYDKDPLWVYPP